jgi:hypothetical protein
VTKCHLMLSYWCFKGLNHLCFQSIQSKKNHWLPNNTASHPRTHQHSCWSSKPWTCYHLTTQWILQAAAMTSLYLTQSTVHGLHSMLTTDVICQQMIWQCAGLGSNIPGISSFHLQNIFTMPNFPGPQLTLTVLPLFVIITDPLTCVSTYVQIHSGCWLPLEWQWRKPKLGTACVKTKIPWWWQPRSAETWKKGNSVSNVCGQMGWIHHHVHRNLPLVPIVSPTN